MNKAVLNTLLAAVFSLRVNRTRAIITMLIIALGIASLVGMQTAIDGLKWSLINNLNTLGNNTFSITKDSNPLRFGPHRAKDENAEISYRDAVLFKKNPPENTVVSLSVNASLNVVAHYKSTATSNTINVTGVDEHFLRCSGYELEAGRNFSESEIEHGAHVAIIGRELNNLLFSENFLGINKEIFIADRKFRVIGVTKAKGSSFGISLDKNASIPLQCARKSFSSTIGSDYSIKVAADNVFELEKAITEATGKMRLVRHLKSGAPNNFGITKSDSLQDLLETNLSYVSAAALVIGLITLSGALIALMNIMFVSITERTREIGTRMAVGASASLIRLQFLSEATFISIVGGIFGIILGLIIGNAVIFFLKLDANLPYQWIAISFLLCACVGVAAGYLPAKKAASLDPIESLRYE
ncbi:FtsX-like permease family protein [bacterium]|nr:FtsX-like permease family protein [bacterium]